MRLDAAGMDPAPPEIRTLGSIAACREGLAAWLTATARAVGSGRQSRQLDIIAQLTDYV